MLRRSVLSLFLASCVLACGESTSPSDEIRGTWRLETVNGVALPFILEQDGTRKVELTAETINLRAANSMTMVTGFRVTDAGGVFTESIPADGTYTVEGSTVLMVFPSDGSTLTATVSDDLMTLDDIGLRFVYRRE